MARIAPDSVPAHFWAEPPHIGVTVLVSIWFKWTTHALVRPLAVDDQAAWIHIRTRLLPAALPACSTRARDKLRTLHCSYRTVQQYLQWVRRFILFHDKRQPRKMNAPEVEAFLTHLAVTRKVSASTQNQALAALLFLYQKVLELELPWLEDVVRAKPSRHLPVVLTHKEVRDVLKHYGKWQDIAAISGQAGLRRIAGFRDEALAGQWRGFRSSRLNLQYRAAKRRVALSVGESVALCASCRNSARINWRR